MHQIRWMNRAATVSTLILGAISAASVQAAPRVPSLDILGIKIGTNLQQAMAAVKAVDGALQIDGGRYRLEGFSQPMMPLFNATNGQNAKEPETLHVLLTIPPNKEAVWGVMREHHYSSGAAGEKTLIALRNKYGPESAAHIDQTGAALSWVFDAQGNLLPAKRAAQLGMAPGASTGCLITLEYYFVGAGDSSAMQDATFPFVLKKHTPCLSATVIFAQVNWNDETKAVSSLIQWIADGPTYRAAIEATSAAVANAAASRAKKQAEEVDKRAGPKL